MNGIPRLDKERLQNWTIHDRPSDYPQHYAAHLSWPGPSARTGKHYDQDERIDEKREALRRLADEIRRIVDEPVQAESVDLERRLAA